MGSVWGRSNRKEFIGRTVLEKVSLRLDCQSGSDRELSEKDQNFEMIPSIIIREQNSEISIGSFQISQCKNVKSVFLFLEEKSKM